MDTSFDRNTAYLPMGDVCFDDGRENELLDFVYGRPDVDELRGSPERVLAAIDEYGRTKRFLMNVGQQKGKIVANLVTETRPRVMVELGGYVGYSAILFGSALRKAGGTKYLTLERNPEFAAVIESLVDLAGLSDIVEVVVGPSDESLRRLHADGQLSVIDLLFLDHYKPAYLTDLKLCEELGLVRPWSVLAADNVIDPGNPPYLEYVRSPVDVKNKKALEHMPESVVKEHFNDRHLTQYQKRHGDEKLPTFLRGDPRLVYKSQLINSFEPTGAPDGIEVTRCIDRV